VPPAFDVVAASRTALSRDLDESDGEAMCGRDDGKVSRPGVQKREPEPAEGVSHQALPTLAQTPVVAGERDRCEDGSTPVRQTGVLPALVADRSEVRPSSSTNRRKPAPLTVPFAAADAIDLETLKHHQDRIRTGLADIDRRLATEHDQHEGSRKQLSTALSLLVDCATLYACTDDQASAWRTRR